MNGFRRDGRVTAVVSAAQLAPSTSSAVQPTIENEKALLEYFIATATAHGLQWDRQSLIHFYVTVKTHASILVVGPANSGKIALVQAFVQAVTTEPVKQSQMMVGHAHWASRTHNIANFVELQSRFNDNQILSLMMEGSSAENHRELFIACLTRITPFEIYRYLSVPGFQFWPWMSHQKGSRDAERVVPFPANFRLISTMDADRFQWCDSDLLTYTAVVQRPAGAVFVASQPIQSTSYHRHIAFTDLCVLETAAAYCKLKQLLRGSPMPFAPLLQVSAIMRAHGVRLPSRIMNQSVKYLANAWSEEGDGLFDVSNKLNLQIGQDMTLVQYLLPWAAASGLSTTLLQENLAQLLDDRFPRAAYFLHNWPNTRSY